MWIFFNIKLRIFSFQFHLYVLSFPIDKVRINLFYALSTANWISISFDNGNISLDFIPLNPLFSFNFHSFISLTYIIRHYSIRVEKRSKWEGNIFFMKIQHDIDSELNYYYYMYFLVLTLLCFYASFACFSFLPFLSFTFQYSDESINALLGNYVHLLYLREFFSLFCSKIGYFILISYLFIYWLLLHHSESVDDVQLGVKMN